MRRHVLRVQTHGEVYGLLEQLNGDFRHTDERSRVLHALGVLLGSEDTNGLVIGAPRGFQTLIALHSIIQARGHAMQAKEGIFDESWRCPLPSLDRIGGFDMAIDLAYLESNVVPV
jgi:hypothetical protein